MQDCFSVAKVGAIWDLKYALLKYDRILSVAFCCLGIKLLPGYNYICFND